MILDDESQTGVFGMMSHRQVCRVIAGGTDDDESQTGVSGDCRWHR